MSDWYLLRQLQYFKDGVRGAHPDDLYGMQMAMMAASLRDEQAMQDLVAYINSLYRGDPSRNRPRFAASRSGRALAPTMLECHADQRSIHAEHGASCHGG